jgi:asparagine synthase (glutamine-hydrolysing)
VLIADPREFQSEMARLLWYFDEPLNHPNSIPLYLLSRFARKWVTVVLTGEGSDELFAGYPRYHIARLRARFGAAATPTLRALASVAARVPGHRADLLAENLPLSFVDSLLVNSRYVAPQLVSRLVGYDVLDTLDERRALAERSVTVDDGVGSITRFDLQTYLGSLLDRIDRMAMAIGLEARVPFLDLTMLELGLRLHSSLKVRGRENKRVVKHLARRTLHRRITDGAKSGFGVPLGAWFRDASFAPLVRRLEDPEHPAAQLLDREMVRHLVDRHRDGDVDNGQILWLLANVYLWHEVQGIGPATPAAEFQPVDALPIA